LVALTIIAILTRFVMLNYPRQVVFDEFHFGKFINGYLTGEYFFDIHPPLGKLLLAFSGWLGGYDGKSMAWAAIGDSIPPDVNLFSLRAVPALQGSLLVPLVYLTARELGISPAGALLPACGVLFDLCFLIESRLVLTDATLFCAVVLQLYASASSDKFEPLTLSWTLRTALAGLAIGIAVSTKWTGASTVAVAGLHSLVALWRTLTFERSYPSPWRRVLSSLLCQAVVRAMLLLAVPLTMYISSFYVHFALLPRTGSGASFMKPNFRATLAGDKVNATVLEKLVTLGKIQSTELPTFWSKFIELNQEMLRANSQIRNQHIWGSNWWEWPLMQRSVLYWKPPHAQPPYATDALPYARIYCIGSPLVWWMAAVAPSLIVAMLLSSFFAFASLPSWPPSRNDTTDQKSSSSEGPARVCGALGGCSHLELGRVQLLLGYLINWLPFIMVERVAFLYHFLPSLLFALMLLGVGFDAAIPSKAALLRSSDRQVSSKAHDAAAGVSEPMYRLALDEGNVRWIAAAGIVAAMSLFFAFFAPLVYGPPMTHADFKARMWLKTWE